MGELGVILMTFVTIVSAGFVAVVFTYIILKAFGEEMDLGKDYLKECNVYRIMKMNDYKLNLASTEGKVYLHLDESMEDIVEGKKYGILRLYIKGEETPFLEHNGSGLIGESWENLLPIYISKPYKKEIQKALKKEYKKMKKSDKEEARKEKKRMKEEEKRFKEIMRGV